MTLRAYKSGRARSTRFLCEKMKQKEQINAAMAEKKLPREPKTGCYYDWAAMSLNKSRFARNLD